MKTASKATKVNTKAAVAYLRVSTEDQQLGPEAQRAAIGAWAAREGVEVIAWHLDQGVSGGADVDDRPGLVAALATLRVERAGILLVAKRDRLARDVYIAATIERAVARGGGRVACADGVANGETPADAFMRAILDAAAAYERALIRARTKAALQVKRNRGESTGTAPYGFRTVPGSSALVPDEAEQRTLAALRALRARGLPFRRVRDEAVARGLVSRTGRPFTLQAVYAMVGGTAPRNGGQLDEAA
jgi:DNA invertase Pin-like site-specific DNA recombinase